jgi:hypothetical protein
MELIDDVDAREVLRKTGCGGRKVGRCGKWGRRGVFFGRREGRMAMPADGPDDRLVSWLHSRISSFIFFLRCGSSSSSSSFPPPPKKGVMAFCCSADPLGKDDDIWMEGRGVVAFSPIEFYATNRGVEEPHTVCWEGTGKKGKKV